MNQKTKNRQDTTKVSNVLASLQSILTEIALDGQLYTTMNSTNESVKFTFHKGGIQASFFVEKGGIL